MWLPEIRASMNFNTFHARIDMQGKSLNIPCLADLSVHTCIIRNFYAVVPSAIPRFITEDSSLTSGTGSIYPSGTNEKRATC